MSKKRFIAIRNQAESNTLELFFLDVIQDNYDWWTGMFYSKVQEIIDKVNFYKPQRIKCIIDSGGGDAQLGISIYNYLKRIDAKVEVEIIGIAGSIASVIAMAANRGKLLIAKNGFMMIHKAEGIVVGTADEIRQGAELVDKYTQQIVDIYSLRTGKSADDINGLMANGDFWMSGDEAVTQGFADDTFNDQPNVKIAACLYPEQQLKNIPVQIRAQLKPDEETEDSKTFFQKQFDDMKKFFTEIVNAIKGVKPVEGTPITNQIAEAVTAPFEKLADEIETTITNKVNETIVSKPVNDAISLQVTNAVTAAVDFSKEGAGKTAIDAAVKVAVDAITAEWSGKITALETTNTALKKKNEDLELDITNMKGNKHQANPAENGVVPIGRFN